MSRSRPLAMIVSLLLAVVLAGCGVDESAAPGRQAPEGGPDGTFPVTVEHKYGSTTVPAKPKRVVTLGLSDQDAVLALGVVPVGAVDWFKERPYGLWPWTKELWGDTPPTIVGERDDFDKEKILNLKPDLVLALYSGMSKEQYDELSKFVPVVGQPKGFEDYGAPWQDMTRLAGAALGEQDRVEKLISDIDDRFAAIRDEHPQWQGRSIAVADPMQPGMYAVFQETDPKAAFMVEMGFTVPDSINEAAGDNNAAEISTERSDLIDQDLLLMLTLDPTAEARVKADPIFQQLAAVRENRTLFVPYAEPPVGAAISFNTVLSIPYAMDQLVPLLPAG